MAGQKSAGVVQSGHLGQEGGKVPEWVGLSIEEAAEMSGYSPEYLRRLCRYGRLEAEKISGYLIKEESLKAYIREMQESGDGRAGPRD